MTGSSDTPGPADLGSIIEILHRYGSSCQLTHLHVFRCYISSQAAPLRAECRGVAMAFPPDLTSLEASYHVQGGFCPWCAMGAKHGDLADAKRIKEFVMNSPQYQTSTSCGWAVYHLEAWCRQTAVSLALGSTPPGMLPHDRSVPPGLPLRKLLPPPPPPPPMYENEPKTVDSRKRRGYHGSESRQTSGAASSAASSGSTRPAPVASGVWSDPAAPYVPPDAGGVDLTSSDDESQASSDGPRRRTDKVVDRPHYRRIVLVASYDGKAKYKANTDPTYENFFENSQADFLRCYDANMKWEMEIGRHLYEFEVHAYDAAWVRQRRESSGTKRWIRVKYA